MRGRLAVVLIAGAACVACGDGESERAPGYSVFAVPESLTELKDETFFDHPWPSSFRLESDGSVRFAGYPNPRELPLLDLYFASMAGVLEGFSPAAGGFLRFTSPLDPKSLPASPADGSSAKSSVQLIDITPSADEYGQRMLIRVRLAPSPAVYYPDNTLVFQPVYGYPLRPEHRYALVVTSKVRTASGARIQAAPELREVLGLESATGARAKLRDAWAQDVKSVETAGVVRRDIVHLSVFSTADPVAETRALRDWVVKEFDAPTVRADTWQKNDKDLRPGVMEVYEGVYGPSPDFQRGKIPFAQAGDGGELAFDASGTPEVQREFDLRFTLAVPDSAACPMPSAGYPIVLYAHGTGGSYRSLLGATHEARALAKRCIASMGIDQIFHGTRPGADGGTPDLLFFNVQNLVAARANGPQSAIDVVQQARLFTVSKLTVPASVTYSGKEIRFDATKLGFFGHSQGGLNGPLYLALDDGARGGVLSGSASMITIALLEKTKPFNIAGLVKTIFLALSVDEEAELDEFHPAMSLAQTIIDPTDPIHYVRYIAREPRAGFAPKSVLMTEGVNADGSGDSYATPRGIEVQAIALGLPPQEPVIHPPLEAQFDPSLAAVAIPKAGLTGNLADGKASGVLAQWEAAKASDGHFVIYDIPEAMDQCAEFMRNLMAEPAGRVPAP
ncbi:MAG: hypothetical protein R3B13_04050 [Polyangiaceae bacterium]